jgi:hypothetical protein
MFTYHPIEDTTTFHGGFYAILIILIIFAIAIWRDDLTSTLEKFGWSAGLALIILIVHAISFSGTHPTNTPIQATFVGFQPEVAVVRQGKRDVDKHDIYVIWEVNGEQVIMPGIQGYAYPKNTILWQN